MEDQAKRIIFDLFPGRFNKSGYDEAEFESILVILRDCFQEVKGPEITRIQNKFVAEVERRFPKDHHHDHHGHIHKRSVGGNHKHTFKDSQKIYTHHILHELTHAFHLGSLVILTILVLEVNTISMCSFIYKFLQGICQKNVLVYVNLTVESFL
jgi:hypothetical protein